MRVDEMYYTNSKNQKLACTFFYPNKFNPEETYETIPVGHGMGGSDKSDHIPPSIERITQSGRIGVSFNFRGAHPDRPDTREATPENWKDDLHCVMQYIAGKKFVNKEKIIPIMASYSGNIVAQYAADPNSVSFAGIIQNAMAVRPMRKFEKKLKEYAEARRRLWSITKYHSADIDGKICQLPYGICKFFSKYDVAREAAPKITAPMVFIHGTEDDLAPIEDAQEFAKAMTKSPCVQFHVIKGAPHNMKGDFLSQAIELSAQAVDMFSTKNYGKIVDVNGNAYDSDHGQHLKIA